MNGWFPIAWAISRSVVFFMVELILGGVRSGKSRYAEHRAEASGLQVRYLATARCEAHDAEMMRRIAQHRARRPAHWACIEEPIELAATLRRQASADACLLVDCLTLWLSNLLFAGQAARQVEAGEAITCPLFEAQITALIDVLPHLPGQIILVSNEVGWGIVPANALARAFADQQGWLNQRIAAISQRVTLIAAGLPLELKGNADENRERDNKMEGNWRTECEVYR